MTAAGGERVGWFRRFPGGADATARLVCFPHAGGSASFFFPMARLLAPAVEVVGVQYPGRQDRRTDRPVEDLCELADRISAAAPELAGRPLAFFGHSMGAVVAFEVARRLERRGAAAPLVLFASGRRAPSRHWSQGVHLRDDDGVVAELRRLSGTESQMLGDEEVLRMILPAVRADYRAIETYRCAPGAAVRCPIVVLVGDRDSHTTLPDARAWRVHTTGAVEVRAFPGGHFFLNDHRADVAAEITRGLRTAQEAPA